MVAHAAEVIVMVAADDARTRDGLRSMVLALRRAFEGHPDGYGWANRLLALRCLEARELCDEVILPRPVYGGRSLAHHRFAQQHPDRCLGEDDGLYGALEQAFAEQALRLPRLFARDESADVEPPPPAALTAAIRALAGQAADGPGEQRSRAAFQSADALGWAYQYWHAERRAALLERLRSEPRFKLEGPHLVAATQLYTEPYMVRFLVDNTLGAIAAVLHPDQPTAQLAPLRLEDAPLPELRPKRVEEITVLDPACGSGHFLLGAFDALYAMYERQGSPTDPAEICACILERNLFGIDLDPRALQLAEASLWMRAAERCGRFDAVRTNLACPPADPDGDAAEIGSLLRVAAGPSDGSLFDLLGRRYDVVLANPPYVDKRHQGGRLRAALRAGYPEAKGNTFAAFIVRALELAQVAVGMVTPQTFLFVRSYEGLRRRLTASSVVASLVQLGSGAFRD
ncbi:MAG: N-6 DNA methylase, partial [Deltaproteobacteria bacterium]|nr:N-6 DNA methylase [Deltaproteobacteria bacterium]MBW2531352.1 N-6 DNA methylase [Deltaproteobacteria bacterium]